MVLRTIGFVTSIDPGFDVNFIFFLKIKYKSYMHKHAVYIDPLQFIGESDI